MDSEKQFKKELAKIMADEERQMLRAAKSKSLVERASVLGGRVGDKLYGRKAIEEKGMFGPKYSLNEAGKAEVEDRAVKRYLQMLRDKIR